LGGVALLLLLLVSPALIRGSPLADEYVICLRPIHDRGYSAYLQEIWHDTGVVRPSRLIELFLISTTCTRVPWGLVMLVPLALKFAVGIVLYGLLRDLDLEPPWPAIGATVWLLEPLGTEAALWPAALHVNLGLLLAVAALRLYRRGRPTWAAVATLGACLSVEQAIFAIPLAVWLVCPKDERRRATVIATSVAFAVLAAYATWPGENPRHAVPLSERVAQVFSDPEWFVVFPIVGLGLHSGFFGFVWGLPYSIGVLSVGILGGAALFRGLLPERTGSPDRWTGFGRAAIGIGGLVLLVNVPLITTEVGYSPRTFTPTWLVLSGASAFLLARIRWDRPWVLGAMAGTFAAFAALSLALSVSVRVRTAAFDRAAAEWIAARTEEGDVVAVCDVERTVVEPAPSGSFHLHALHPGSAHWVEYHTGRVVDLRRRGERYWGSRCPDLRRADLVIDFPDLVRVVGTSGDER
jgi:hypothetical protein